jgi:hypothetical protein
VTDFLARQSRESRKSEDLKLQTRETDQSLADIRVNSRHSRVNPVLQKSAEICETRRAVALAKADLRIDLPHG